MIVKRVSLKKANEHILRHHRHHGAVQGHIFTQGVYFDGEIAAVAVTGRPVSRGYNADEVCEVTRLCSVGLENACSKLYATCARIAKEMGFKKIITYILESEPATSLKAAGWTFDGIVIAREWRRNDGERTRVVSNLFGDVEKYPIDENRQRWVKILEKQ